MTPPTAIVLAGQRYVRRTAASARTKIHLLRPVASPAGLLTVYRKEDGRAVHIRPEHFDVAQYQRTPIMAGSEATREEVNETGRRLTEKMRAHAAVRRELAAKAQQEGRAFDAPRRTQYLGQVKDLFPGHARLHPNVANAHVFYDHNLRDAAGLTNGRTINLGARAFAGQGSSRSVGDTFVHEIEHLVDEHAGRTRTEFTPRFRQMLREIEPGRGVLPFLGRHGADFATDHVRSYFADHPGHELTPAELADAAVAVQTHAMQLYQQHGYKVDD